MKNKGETMKIIFTALTENAERKMHAWAKKENTDLHNENPAQFLEEYEAKHIDYMMRQTLKRYGMRGKYKGYFDAPPRLQGQIELKLIDKAAKTIDVHRKELSVEVRE